MRFNPLLMTDSYKTTHWKQYPPDAEVVYSYFESRGGEYKDLIFFGLQPILDLLAAGFTRDDIEEAATLITQHIGPRQFNYEQFHKLRGKWPVRIHAVPEGSLVHPHDVLITVENTDPRFPWVTNYLESLISHVWYPTTVASLSKECRRVIGAYLKDTGSDPVDFKLHDFGYRGASSNESAAIGGAAHLVNFMGTDTLLPLALIGQHYVEPCAGFSIPAAEHSTITSWGKDGEREAFANMLKQYPEGLVAVVSDSYNIYHACDQLWGQDLKAEVLGRNGTVIIRPDSGEPQQVIPRLLLILEKRFGAAYNGKGFKVLDPHVRLIQGDGVNPLSIRGILARMASEQWSADNIAFGMGGALLQRVNRDTCKFAFKCSAIRRAGTWHDVYKQPVDAPDKNSKRGRFQDPSLVEVFRDGVVTTRYSFSDIRARAAQQE